MSDKWIAKSMTVWGVIIAVAPMLGIDVSMLTEAVGHAKNAYIEGQQGIGMILAAIGVRKAMGGVSLVPGGK